MTDRDPVAEAVERAVDALVNNTALREGVRPEFGERNVAELSLTAALAPYGGLEAAIRKLEEGE